MAVTTCALIFNSSLQRPNFHSLNGEGVPPACTVAEHHLHLCVVTLELVVAAVLEINRLQLNSLQSSLLGIC